MQRTYTKQEYIDCGDYAVEKQKYQLAIKLYSAVIDVEGDNTELLIKRARALTNQYNYVRYRPQPMSVFNQMTPYEMLLFAIRDCVIALKTQPANQNIYDILTEIQNVYPASLQHENFKDTLFLEMVDNLPEDIRIP